jgi:hypothetical protein
VEKNNYMFPGRWLGGIALILGPTLLFIGVVLRFKFNFFFPDQLEAFRESPILITISYSAFLVGNILMWPAILLLVNLMSNRSPQLAFWGGLLVILGLFARTFHAGIDHLAFQVVNVQSLKLATKIVADSYGAFHIVSTLNLAIMVGWIILAIGGYRSKVLNIFNSVALGLMSTLPLGVLKGTTIFSIIATAGLCAACIPLGVKTIKNGPNPGVKKVIISTLLTASLLSFFFYFGQMG